MSTAAKRLVDSWEEDPPPSQGTTPLPDWEDPMTYDRPTARPDLADLP